MPYNGSGSFGIINTFLPATVISSSQMNTNFTDIATGLSSVLVRDGQGTGMTGQFKAADGTAMLPGVTFQADQNTGLYRVGADSLGVAMGGSQAAFWDAALKLWLQDELDVAGVVNFQAALTMVGATMTGDLDATGQEVTADELNVTDGAETAHIHNTGINVEFDIEGTPSGAHWQFGRFTDTGGNNIFSVFQPNTADLVFQAQYNAGDPIIAGDSIATQLEAETGSRNDKLMTPLRTAQAITEQAGEGAKAWVAFDDAGNIQGSFNVSSVAMASTGLFEITWDTDFANTNYVAVGSTIDQSDQTVVCFTGKAVGSIEARIFNTNDGQVNRDTMVVAFGNQ